MTTLQRIGTILLLTLAIVFVSSLGGAHGVKPIITANAQSLTCTGCPYQGTRDDCSQCHNFTYRNAGDDGCTDCYFIYPDLAAKTKGRPTSYELGSITGNPMKMYAKWRDIPMPSDHRKQALAFRARVPDCQGRKLVTE